MSICVYDSLPDEAVEIRENVFVKEQGFEKEFDEIDEKAIHLVMFDEHLQKQVVTCRIYKGSKPVEFILGRLAVISECRGMNLGSDMIQKAEEVVREKGGDYLSPNEIPELLDPELPQQLLVSAFRRYRR